MSKDESIPTPTFGNYGNAEVDFSRLLKERIAKSTDRLNYKEYKNIKLKLNKKMRFQKIRIQKLSSKSYTKSRFIKNKHCSCYYCPNIVFKNIYDRKHMIRFIVEKVKAFEGADLENETIDNESS